jgi:L-gulono-1,4-lactone dehydrogenase
MWENWARYQACVPAAFERPATTEEVAAAVARAADAGRTLRVAGAGHSFSDAVLTEGTLLSLERMDAVLDVDRASGLVRVQAGITLARLNAELLGHRLALPNLGDIDRQHLGGALATGTHGTGGQRQNISAQVTSALVVTGDGTAQEIDEGDLLRAVRVSTGSLGVLAEVELRCVPAFRLHAVDVREPLEEVLVGLEERVEANHHFELFTFPHSPWALTRTNNITEAPATGPPPWRRHAEQIWLDNHVFEALLRTGRRAPGLIPALNRLAGAASSRRERVDESFRIFASPRLTRFNEMEYAIPRAHAAEATREVRAILERHPVSFPVELRFVASDDALLSPSHGRETAYVAVHVYAGMDYEAAFREVEQLMARYDGRPHWGKRSFLTAAELASRYPRWDAFQAARARLDPDGRFTNAYTARMLGPVAVPAVAR